MKLKVLIITLSLITGLMSFASQPDELVVPQDDGSKYGKDSATCVMNLSLYREFYKQWKNSKYKNTSNIDAMKSWRWVYNNCPRSTENIYVDGVKMVSYKIKSHTFRFRFDPMPGTGKWKTCARPYMRRPRTTHEKRWAYAHKEYVRARRFGHNLPETWDDMWIADNADRGWKRSKKKRQWLRKGDKLMQKDGDKCI